MKATICVGIGLVEIKLSSFVEKLWELFERSCGTQDSGKQEDKKPFHISDLHLSYIISLTLTLHFFGVQQNQILHFSLLEHLVLFRYKVYVY